LLKGDKVNSESEHAGGGEQGTETLQSKGCITIIIRQEDSMYWKDKCFSKSNKYNDKTIKNIIS
jgi:hypothetical protein